MKPNQDTIGRPARLGAQLQLAFALTVWLGALPSLLAQAVPDRMNYQGILLQGNGAPVTTRTDVEFRIYDSSQGGTLLWARSHRITPDTNGAFNVVLMEGESAIETGSPAYTSLSSVFTSAGSDVRYMELTVQGSTPIFPRQRFVPAPYAFLASDALTLNKRPPTDYFLPPGMVAPFAGPATAGSEPAGWLLCDGRAVSRTTYARLFGAIGTAWGQGDGSSTFNLPDLRGLFLRGVNGTRLDRFADPDRDSREAANPGGNSANSVGTVQTNKLATHNHLWGQTTAGAWNAKKIQSWTSMTASSVTDILLPFAPQEVTAIQTLLTRTSDNSFYVSPESATLYTKPESTEYRTGETRPNNAYVNYIIKY
jgi:microcystin-dependent protein